MSEEIINGIDVSECEFYFEDNGVIAPDGTPERANICTSPERSCENNDSCYCNKDCYFKQLKRLEKENEALINGLGIANKYVNKYHKTLQEIKEIAEQADVDCIYRISVIRKILTKVEVD